MKRGDIVTAAAPGDSGKPRPAIVVQSDLFNPTHPSIVICPLTSHLADAPLFRINIEPARGSGLKKVSQVMIDKIVALKRERIKKVFGSLPPEDMLRVEQALALWLDLDRGRHPYDSKQPVEARFRLRASGAGDETRVESGEAAAVFGAGGVEDVVVAGGGDAPEVLGIRSGCVETLSEADGDD